jgi:hypothetical protein
VIAIFNPLIKDSGKLILKTSQMNLHDAFSDASIISRASRSSSALRSHRDRSIEVLSPSRSIASSLQRQISTPPTTAGYAVDSDVCGQQSLYNPRVLISLQKRMPNDIPLATHGSSTSSISSPSLISRVPSISDQVVDLGVPEGRASPIYNPTLTLPTVVTSLQHSTPWSMTGSPTTRAIVAA